jgi:hypothetical protein
MPLSLSQILISIKGHFECGVEAEESGSQTVDRQGNNRQRLKNGG